MHEGAGTRSRVPHDETPQRGWYPDPWSVDPVRWWDGRRWTVFTTERRAEHRDN